MEYGSLDRISLVPDRDSPAAPAFEIQRRGTGLVVVVGPGALGSRESSAITGGTGKVLADRLPGLRHLVLDLGKARSMSAIGLALCVDLRNRAVAAGLSPVLAGASGEVLDVLRMMKVERLFNVVRSERDLKQLLGG
jgi:anti-anti-sigma factor